jgi:hypothetical protein
VGKLEEEQASIERRHFEIGADIIQFTQKLKWRSPDGVESVDGNWTPLTQKQLLTLNK